MDRIDSDIRLGDRVSVGELDGSRDWTPEAMVLRRPFISGRVVAHSDAHGLCFQVVIDDGGYAWYNEGELTMIGR